MIFDMHCHTMEGSPDGLVSINATVEKLKRKGYDGMLVTDHNSYRGYDNYKNKYDDFVVLRGIEYDSVDGGHLLIILPTRIKYKIFEHRGMEVRDVIKIVHALEGIVGPAHPYDYFKLGICNTKWKEDMELLSQFDFIETFNGCLNRRGEILSSHLAKELDKPCFGGSDSHSLIKVGLGQTEFPYVIKSEDDLIKCVKEADFNTLKASGRRFEYKHDTLHSMSVITGGFAYDIFNHCISVNHKKKANAILGALGVNNG